MIGLHQNKNFLTLLQNDNLSHSLGENIPYTYILQRTYLEYIKNTYNLVVYYKEPSFLNEQKVWTDTS